MISPILLPKQGNSVETCLILSWKKKKGEEVKKDEVICEVETDKAIFELDSPADGILLDIFYKEGEDVPVLTNIAVIGSPGENYEEYLPQQNRPSIKNPESPEEIVKTEETYTNDFKKEINKSSFENNSINEKIRISPRAKKLADKLKLPINEIKGTGPNSRIIEKDVLGANMGAEPLTLASRDLINNENIRPNSGSGIGNRITSSDLQSETQTQIFSLEEESIKVVPLRGIRKLIAERMLESLKNSAQLTLNSSADATALLNLRKRFKESSVFKEFQIVTINDLIHYALVKTLPQHLELNSLLVGDTIEYYNRIHLGFAVDTPRGLIVPVIKNSQSLNLLQMSHEARRLAAASLSGKIDAGELNGATFTITNLGSMGIESFTPVLNLPQTAILGINTIALKPIEVDKNIKFIPHISFSLTVDHRAIDGAAGARFLQSLSKTISEIDLALTSDIMRK